MKKIRICFALIYIIVAIIVTGEMYIYYASSFEDMTALEIDLEEIEQKKETNRFGKTERREKNRKK